MRRRPAPRSGRSIWRTLNSRPDGHIGIIHDPGHPEPWIIAMSERPGYLRTLDYGQRWGIEPMFSDFTGQWDALHHATPSEKSVADQPRKVARSRTSWFTRGLRRIVKIVRSCLPLPPLWAVRLN